jgi:hypothetical protein
MADPTTPHRSTIGILTGAALALVLGGLAALLSRVALPPTVLLIANALAFAVVGWVTLRLRPGARALEPAIGAAVVVLLFGLGQLVAEPELRGQFGWRLIATSLSVSVAFAFSLSWLGARLAKGMARGRSEVVQSARWRRTRRAGTQREPSGAAPESRPAPHSG